MGGKNRTLSTIATLNCIDKLKLTLLGSIFRLGTSSDRLSANIG